MKIKYGKGECFIDYRAEEISSIVIKYRGNVTLRHDFMTIDSILDNERALIKNVNRNNMLVHGNNQIHIGFLNNPDLDKLFDYRGDFRIISAKVNDQNIPVEVFGVDYWNMIDSDWDSAGKPENYKGNYKFGRVPRKKTLKGRKNKTLRQLPKGGY